MDTHLNFLRRKPGLPAPEAGFSMIEMLMAAFILSIGLLGLAALQVMVVKSGTVSKSRTTAIQVGQAILEAIDTEARQQRLFRTFDPGNASIPGLSTYFGGTAITGTYNIYGTPVNSSSSDPLEKATLFTTSTLGTQVATGASATSGKTYQFAVTVNFTDTPNSANPTGTTRSMTFRRTVDL
jgi:prepilin-type N-terminal cleavage/methylation domain-containing protein